MLKHLIGRLKEPSCWGGFAAAMGVTAQAVPEWHKPLYAAAGVCAGLAILVKSGGSQDKGGDDVRPQ